MTIGESEVAGTARGAETGAASSPPIQSAEDSGVGSPSSVSLKQLAIRASMWTVIGFGVSQLLRLGGNLALTRLLSPGVFGVMALVNAVLQGLQMFSDFGTRQSVIQHRRGDDPDFVNTAWTFQAVRGGALWLTACALAAPLSLVYPGTGIGWLLPAAGLTAAIAGLASTKEVTLNRHLNIGRVSMVEIVAQCLGLAVMIVWAWRAPSVWALIGGAIVGVGVRTALTHVVLPGPWNRFCWEVAAPGQRHRIPFRAGRQAVAREDHVFDRTRRVFRCVLSGGIRVAGREPIDARSVVPGFQQAGSRSTGASESGLLPLAVRDRHGVRAGWRIPGRCRTAGSAAAL